VFADKYMKLHNLDIRGFKDILAWPMHRYVTCSPHMYTERMYSFCIHGACMPLPNITAMFALLRFEYYIMVATL